MARKATEAIEKVDPVTGELAPIGVGSNFGRLTPDELDGLIGEDGDFIITNEVILLKEPGDWLEGKYTGAGPDMEFVDDDGATGSRASHRFEDDHGSSFITPAKTGLDRKLKGLEGKILRVVRKGQEEVAGGKKRVNTYLVLERRT